MVARRMKMLFPSTAFALFVTCAQLLAGIRGSVSESEPAKADLNPPRFEVAVESAYLLGAIDPPQDYQVGAFFLTGRVRWGVMQTGNWMRGYNQFYISAVAEPIFQGIEHRYFGFNFGSRYNFVQPGRRWIPYMSGGVGLGWIDSHANIPGGQGQDFTFNILSAAGVSYKVNEKWKIDIGVLYEHFSNGGQTDPNPSLNLFGPQIGATYSF